MSRLSDELKALDDRSAKQHLEGVLHDLVTDESGAEIQWGDQSRAISQLAELLVEQQKRIAALEATLAGRTANRTNES